MTDDLRVRPSPATAFPVPPGRLLGGAAPCAEVSAFLGRTWAWREAARAWVASSAAASAPISDEMQRILRAALGDPDVAPNTLAAARTYRVEPFPVLAANRTNGDCKDERRYLLEVMVWRSRLVDFLSDVWDVIGPPLLEMEECEWAIRELFTPQSAERVCPSCLQPMPSPEFERNHFDTCVVRIAREA